MACEKKWAVFAVFVSVIVVIAVIVPIAMYTRKGRSAQANAPADGGAMAPNEMFVQFAAMIHCTTKANPLDYQGYGCNCGLLNGGGTPVDEADRCCQTHDRCMEALETSGVCRKGSFLTTIYSMKIRGCKSKRPATVTCKPASEYNLVQTVAAMGKAQCAAAMCQCDRQAALCLSQHTLNDRFKMANKGTFQCQGNATQGPPMTEGPFGTQGPRATPFATGNPNVAVVGGNAPAPVYRFD